MRLRKSEKPQAPVKKNPTLVEINHIWAKLDEEVKRIKGNVKVVGDHIAWLLDNDPCARATFKERGYPHSFIDRMERVGRGTLLPELALTGSVFERLSLDEQKKVVSGQVPVIRETAKGWEVENADLRYADAVVVYRAVGSNRLRTPEEQIQFVMRLRSEGAEAAQKVGKKKRRGWEITKSGKVLFLANHTFSRNQLLMIIKVLDKELTADQVDD